MDASIIFDKVSEVFDTIAITALKRLGEDALRYAIENRLWQDYTGNLQDSMGYGIYKDGELIFSNQVTPRNYEWGNPGGRVPSHDEITGNEAFADTMDSFQVGIKANGFTLVVVAGMGYALNVETMNSHQVLTQAFQFTADNWANYFTRI